MKLLLIIILAGGGYYFFIQKPKADAYNEYISGSKSGSGSKSSNSSSGSDFREYTSVSQSDYKGLSKSETIKLAINNVHALHDQLNAQLKGSSKAQGAAIKVMIDDFLKDYIKALGKAYTASSGDDKGALKTLKTFIVNWYQRMSYIEQQYSKFSNMIKYSSSGNLSTMQATNRHALTELSKLIKDDNHYVTTFRNNYFASIKKYGISNSHIKGYASQIAKDLNRIYNSRIAVNNSLKTLIDKVYAFNSFVLRNNKNGYISINNRGKYDALVRIVNEIKAAESAHKSTRAAYYNKF
ncbi:MAG: hypothetical protein NE328_15770 [Lentisphaeraceae bacterium]|nr:hypothetical protein [Lentisphaeraceae bacterium]